MQRRAAAVYVVFFLVIGAASYSLIATAQSPTIQFQNPEHRLAQGDQFTVGEQTYTVSNVQETEESGGHGGGTKIVRSGELSWVNQSARYTATWQNNSTTTLQETNYRVLIEPEAGGPSSFTLREEINRTAILLDDPNADEDLVMHNGEENVVITENNETRLVPASEYFPDPETRTLNQGQTIDYQGNQTTVDAVTNSSVTLAWTAPKENTLSLRDQSNVTLSGGQTYLAFFPSGEEVILTQDYETYNRQTENIESYHEHVNGLWGVSILSALSIVFLVGFAYMPSRY